MGIADEFERRLERLVEGAFSKAFRSDIEPAEIGRRLLREMELGKSVSVGAVYVPNAYTIRLADSDYSRFEGLVPELKKEFVRMLKEQSKERRWKPAGAISVRFEHDDSTKPGRFTVSAGHESIAEPEKTSSGGASLQLEGVEEAKWTLSDQELTIGRGDTNDVVLSDNGASRKHAVVSFREGEWWVDDLGSTNGTFVNGTMIAKRELKDGDRITVGGSELLFTKKEED